MQAHLALSCALVGLPALLPVAGMWLDFCSGLRWLHSQPVQAPRKALSCVSCPPPASTGTWLGKQHKHCLFLT